MFYKKSSLQTTLYWRLIFIENLISTFSLLQENFGKDLNLEVALCFIKQNSYAQQNKTSILSKAVLNLGHKVARLINDVETSIELVIKLRKWDGAPSCKR